MCIFHGPVSHVVCKKNDMGVRLTKISVICAWLCKPRCYGRGKNLPKEMEERFSKKVPQDEAWRRSGMEGGRRDYIVHESEIAQFVMLLLSSTDTF